MVNKRRRTNEGRGKRGINPSADDMSNLPDDILENILKRLSVRDAVRTTILSSKWKDKWMTVQQFVFDENYRKPTTRKVVLTNKFLGIVNNVLTQHRGEISKFKLSVLYLKAESALYHIRHWIYLLSKKNIQDLTIEVKTRSSYFGCDALFACENLRVLKLKLGRLVVPESDNEFKNLKDVWLEDIAIYKDLNKLLSKCPQLERLTLVNIPMHPLEIDIKTVKYLHIQGVSDLRIINAKSVTNFVFHRSTPVASYYHSRADSSKLCATLSRLPEIERLELSSDSMEFLALGGVPMKLPIMLNKLIDLFLVINFGDMAVVSTALSLLRSAPNLKRLKISAWFQPILRNSSVENFWRSEHEYFCHLKHLKGLILEQASGTKSEVEFIHYLLKNSPKLEKMTIDGGENICNGAYKWVHGVAPHKRSMIEVLRTIN